MVGHPKLSFMYKQFEANIETPFSKAVNICFDLDKCNRGFVVGRGLEFK